MFLACCVLPDKKPYGNRGCWYKYVRDINGATQRLKATVPDRMVWLPAPVCVIFAVRLHKGLADSFCLDRNRHGGGVLAYVKNDIFCVRRFDYESEDNEILWLELKTSNFRCLYIAVCYLPPNSNSLLKQKFTDSLSTLLALYLNKGIVL